MSSSSVRFLWAIILKPAKLSFISCRFRYLMRILTAFIDYKCAINCWSAICIWSFIIPVFEFISSFFIICSLTRQKCFHFHIYSSPTSLLSLSFIRWGYFSRLWVTRFEFHNFLFFNSFRRVSFHIWVGTSWGLIKD